MSIAISIATRGVLGPTTVVTPNVPKIRSITAVVPRIRNVLRPVVAPSTVPKIGGK